MARRGQYSFQKRQREAAKRKKQQEKRDRKRQKGKDTDEGGEELGSEQVTSSGEPESD